MKTDSELKQHLQAQLDIAPGINRENIKISVKNGIVTLKGKVASYAEKLAAAKAVKHLDGMTGFINEVGVHIPATEQRTDVEIADTATKAISCITTVPMETIKITALAGWLTLVGTLESWQEKEAAEEAVHHLTGVVGVNNLIAVKSTWETVKGAGKDASGNQASGASIQARN